MPYPRKGQTREEYISEFMESAEAKKSFPDEKQRVAVAESEWREHQKKRRKKNVDSKELILKSLADPSRVDLSYGISTAESYLRHLSPCFDGEGGLCPVKAFRSLAEGEKLGAAFFQKYGSDRSYWQKYLADAAGQLTYHDKGMDDVEYITKSINEGTSIGDGVVLTYDCILTTKSVDMEGDRVDPLGLKLTDSMPVLFMHMQMQPVGAMVKVLSQTEDDVRIRNKVLDTELGRDYAVLVKGGALRVSQGFIPVVADPIAIVKGADGKKQAKGWHVKEGLTLENSGVTIPANPESVIFAYSQKKLKTELMNRFAKKFFDARPAQGIGIDLKTKDLSLGPDVVAPGTLSTTTSGTSGTGATNSTPAGDMADTGAAKDPNSGEPKVCPRDGGPLDETGTCSKCGYVAGISTAAIPARAAQAAEGSVGPDVVIGTISKNAQGQLVFKAAKEHDQDMNPGSSGTDVVLGQVSGGEDETGGKGKKKPKKKTGETGESQGKMPEGASGTQDNFISGKSLHAMISKAFDQLGDILDECDDDEAIREMLIKEVGVDIPNLALSLNHKTLNLGKKYLGGMSSYLEGSFEWIADELQDTAINYLRAKNEVVGDAYCSILATYPTYAVVYIAGYSQTERPTYRMDWEMKDGQPMWSGDPKKVEIKAQVVEKLLAAIQLSYKDASAVSLARKLAGKVMAYESPDDVQAAIKITRKTVEMLEQSADAADFLEMFDK